VPPVAARVGLAELAEQRQAVDDDRCDPHVVDDAEAALVEIEGAAELCANSPHLRAPTPERAAPPWLAPGAEHS
jgi:hypothetical protein